jgi:hypothetical protein
MPFDPVIAAGRHWAPGEPLVPRGVMGSIGRLVRAGLGGEAAYIDNTIAQGGADVERAIALAGAVLWPRAAEILAAAPAPEDWEATGLPAAAYEPLAAGLSAVFRRAPHLRDLAPDEDAGVLDNDEDATAGILRNIANESETGCAMLARLILDRSPRAARLLWRIVASGRTQDEKAIIQRSITLGIEATLARLERTEGFAGISQGAVAGAGDEVRRVRTLLREIETGPVSASQRPRLAEVRGKLDTVSRERVARVVREGLVERLAKAEGPIDGPVQTELETCARDFRKLEVAMRKDGVRASRDRLLSQATEAVRAAAEAGILTPVRHCRLVEILLGSEAAEALYLRPV